MIINNPVCATCLYRTQFPENVTYVPPEINNTDRLIIAQEPGKEEKEKLRPLIGPSGSLTMEALQNEKVERKDVSLTNACDCIWSCYNTSPELQLQVINTLQIDLGIDKLSTVAKEATFKSLLKSKCRQKTLWEIENYNPKTVLLMGKSAMEIFDECPYKTVTKAIGSSFELASGQIAYITIHPAAVLHSTSPESKEALLSEFRRGVSAFVNHDKHANKNDLNIQIIDNLDDLKKFVKFIKKKKILSLDWETTGLDFLVDKITSLNVGWSDNDAAVIDLSYWIDTQSTNANEAIESRTNDPEWRSLINEILMCDAEKCCHNGIFELLMAWANGMNIQNLFWDTMTMFTYLHESTMQAKDLNAILSSYCDMQIYDSELNQYTSGNKRISIEEIAANSSDYTFFGPTAVLPKKILFKYAGKDAIATFRALKKLIKEMKKEGSYQCYWEERMIHYAVAEMTYNGMGVDRDRANQMIELAKVISNEARNTIAKNYQEYAAHSIEDFERCNTVVQKIPLLDRCEMQLAGAEGAINPKGAILITEIFNNMGIRCPANMLTEKGQQSWAEPVIAHLMQQFPIETHPLQHTTLRAKLQYEKIQTQLTRYLMNDAGDKGMLLKIHPKTNRIHSSFRAFGTETGRPTSKDPNLYNITTPEKLKEIFPAHYKNIDIRSLFVAPPGWKLVSMDYRQAELRILAMDANYSQKILKDSDKDIEKLILYIAKSKLEEEQMNGYGRRNPSKSEINRKANAIGNEVYSLVQTEWAAPMLQFFIDGLPYPDMDTEKADPERFIIKDGTPRWIDIHSWVASLIENKNPWEVDKNSRRKAKTVIFGLNYGMTEKTLAERLGISIDEAKNLIYRIYEALGNIGIYQKYIEYLATHYRKLTNIYGQVRHFESEITAHNLREAIDFRPQSTVSKLMNRAIIQAYDLFKNQIPEVGAQMVLTVYDDFKFYCPDEWIDIVTPIIQEYMEQPIPGYDKWLPVDIVIGQRWSETENNLEGYDNVF